MLLTADTRDRLRSKKLSGELVFLKNRDIQNEFSQLVTHLLAKQLSVSKAQVEYLRASTLEDKGIVSKRDLEGTQFILDQSVAEIELSIEQQIGRWHGRAKDAHNNLADLVAEEKRLVEAKKARTIVAPTTGVLLSFSGVSEGTFITTGQVIGFVSPDERLLAETFIHSKDVGLLRVGAASQVQVDAFPHTQWGALSGRVLSISGDFISAADQQGFKVLIELSSNRLSLSNGVTAEVKKGMTANATLVVGQRTLWAFLFGKVADWFGA